jgi:hypothetical protein
MHRQFFKATHPMMTVMMVVCSFLVYPATGFPVTTETPDTLSAEKARLLNGEIIVMLSSLEDGVTGVTGKMYIAALPRKVWVVLTDYNNHKKYIPKLIDSGLISDQGDEQVMFQAGKNNIFIFQKTVYIKAESPGRLHETPGFSAGRRRF